MKRMEERLEIYKAFVFNGIPIIDYIDFVGKDKIIYAYPKNGEGFSVIKSSDTNRYYIGCSHKDKDGKEIRYFEFYNNKLCAYEIALYYFDRR